MEKEELRYSEAEGIMWMNSDEDTCNEYENCLNLTMNNEEKRIYQEKE